MASPVSSTAEPINSHLYRPYYYTVDTPLRHLPPRSTCTARVTMAPVSARSRWSSQKPRLLLHVVLDHLLLLLGPKIRCFLEI